MNEDNPPLVLPSGNVYSRDALLALAGVLRDPQTQEAVRVDQLRKAFFMYACSRVARRSQCLHRPLR